MVGKDASSVTAKTVHLLAAARPNFMKIGPLWHALAASEDFKPVLIHTGQHYDRNMSDAIFEDLRLPTPEHHLGVGSGSHAEQTGRVMIEYEKVALAERPDWLVVVGDVNATLAAALVGAKLLIPTAHLEAGLRSRDRTMPEEINRIATDAVCDLLWTPSPDGDRNLIAEGVPEERITRVGNIMLDSFEMTRPQIEAAGARYELGLRDIPYAVATLHRPSNVDQPQELRAMVGCLIEARRQLEIIFPVHPRTAARLAEAGMDHVLEAAGVRLLEPLPYISFMSLVMGAAAVITDSGGLQEETTYLGIPCFTLRENTERPITIEEGTNQLVRPEALPTRLREALAAGRVAAPRPDLWDGRTADRCVDDLRRRSQWG